MKLTARSARLIKEWTQQEAAEKAQMSERTLWAIENGKVPFSKKHQEALAAAYGIKPSDFITYQRPIFETYATKEETKCSQS